MEVKQLTQSLYEHRANPIQEDIDREIEGDYEGDSEFEDSRYEAEEDTLGKTPTPDESPTTNWKIMKNGSNKDKNLLVDSRGYRFNPKATKSSKSTTWRCFKHTSKKCKVTVRQFPLRDDYEQSDFVQRGEHSHPRDLGTEFRTVMMLQKYLFKLINLP